MKAIKLKDVKKGYFFKLCPTETAPVWVRGSYDRMEKKYECYEYYDICHFKYFGANKIVYVDFEF